jgi:hypothetical protein
VPFTPNKSGQRSPPTYYRGGWKTASGRQQGEGGSVIPRIAVVVATGPAGLLLVRRLLQNRRTQIGFLAKAAARVMG